MTSIGHAGCPLRPHAATGVLAIRPPHTCHVRGMSAAPFSGVRSSNHRAHDQIPSGKRIHPWGGKAGGGANLPESSCTHPSEARSAPSRCTRRAPRRSQPSSTLWQPTCRPLLPATSRSRGWAVRRYAGAAWKDTQSGRGKKQQVNERRVAISRDTESARVTPNTPSEGLTDPLAEGTISALRHSRYQARPPALNMKHWQPATTGDFPRAPR